MQIETFRLGQLDTNCYLAWCDATQQAIVIDPADEGSFISEQILENNLELVSIVLTHGHFDHILGLLALKLNFPQAMILAHRDDLFLIASVQKRAQHWLKMQVDPAPKVDMFLEDNDKVIFGEESLQVLHTPGHTPGSICLYNDQVMFTGDTLFRDGIIGRTDFSYSSPQKIYQSLQKIRSLPGSRAMYAGHGRSF